MREVIEGISRGGKEEGLEDSTVLLFSASQALQRRRLRASAVRVSDRLENFIPAQYRWNSNLRDGQLGNYAKF